MSGGRRRESMNPCPEGCRYEDEFGYCMYHHRTGQLRGGHPGPDCPKYEPLDGRPKARDTLRLARREPTGYVHRPTAKQSLENDRRALELYQKGATDPEIAKATGWAKSTVGKWRRDNGLACNRTASSLVDREADAIRLYEQGLSDGAIARSIGCSQAGVFQWRRRTGRKANHRQGWTRKGENNGNQKHDSG